MSEYVKKKLGKRMIEPSRARAIVEPSLIGSEDGDRFREKIRTKIIRMIKSRFVSLRTARMGWTFNG